MTLINAVQIAAKKVIIQFSLEFMKKLKEPDGLHGILVSFFASDVVAFTENWEHTFPKLNLSLWIPGLMIKLRYA